VKAAKKGLKLKETTLEAAEMLEYVGKKVEITRL
jgi:hypothetical protein